MVKKLLLVFATVALLCSGWVGFTGLLSLIGLVPLLIISASYTGSIADTFKVFGWSALALLLWNAATIWWVWIAAPIGPIVASVVSTFWNLLAILTFHIFYHHAPKSLAYVGFVAVWITTEYIYTVAPAMSFPWLTLGNGFSGDTWAIQWYEYTGVFGGSLWVLICNICAFEAIKTSAKRFYVATFLVILVPILFSSVKLGYQNEKWSSSDVDKIEVCAIQPNVGCYDKFHSNPIAQQDNLAYLLNSCSDQATFILMPETSLAETIDESDFANSPIINRLSKQLDSLNSNAMIIAGCETFAHYGQNPLTATARHNWSGYYDIFNSSIAITRDGYKGLHHKGKLVIGVETIPAWLRHAKIGEVDLGGTMGQLGIGKSTTCFEHNNIKVAPAICYEGLYGNYMAGFVREGANAIFVVTNDGWWGNTLGHRYLFSYCRLRAIETRRSVVRSANTGITGMILPNGEDCNRLEWDKRGVVRCDVPLNSKITFYTLHGDYLARMAKLLALLCWLYFIAYRSKKKFYLN